MNKKLYHSFVVIASYSLIGSSMNLSKFGWLKNVSAQIWFGSNLAGSKWICSNLAGSKMGLLKFVLAQIWAHSNLGWLKFGRSTAQIWAALICLAQIWGVIFLQIRAISGFIGKT